MSIGKVHSHDVYRITIVLYHLHTRKVLLKLWLTEVFVIITHMGWFSLRPWKLKVNLQKNEYPPKLIEKLIKYLRRKTRNMPSETGPSESKENIWYFKLPFLGKFSKFTENKLQKLTTQFCEEGTNIKIVFSTFKLAIPFWTKNKVPYGLKFLCASCNANYVGDTYRHISVRTVNIWKMIKILKFNDTFLKTVNANPFVMRTILQF